MEIVAADDTDEGMHVGNVTRQVGNHKVDDVTWVYRSCFGSRMC